AGETVADDPEDLVADVRLQAVQSQDQAALLGQQGTQPRRVAAGQGTQLVIAVQQVGDRALGQDEAASGQFLMDLGEAGVLRVPQGADQGDDVQSELVVGQGEPAFGLGSIGATVAGASDVMAPADVQGQASDAVQSGDGASVVVIDPQGLPAGRTGREGRD